MQLWPVANWPEPVLDSWGPVETARAVTHAGPVGAGEAKADLEAKMGKGDVSVS